MLHHHGRRQQHGGAGVTVVNALGIAQSQPSSGERLRGFDRQRCVASNQILLRRLIIEFKTLCNTVDEHRLRKVIWINLS
jgi:hypothetical protein